MIKKLLAISAITLLLSGCAYPTARPGNDPAHPPLLQIVERNPVGTVSGFVDENNIVTGPLNEISIIFNRDIDRSTLTADNFYALQGIGETVPASIEYDPLSRKASLKFTNPLTANG